MVVKYFLTTEFSYSSLNEQKINILKQFKNCFVKIVKKCLTNAKNELESVAVITSVMLFIVN